MTVSIQFCGAAQTVTGSCYRIVHPGGAFLVDCGLFQGSKTLRELNYGPFPFAPGDIDFALLTHAHIDHSGLVPKLCRLGFKGRIHATEGTRDLLTYMLPDSGYIQEMEVERLNQRNARRGRPQVTPIYTKHDAEASLERIDSVDYDEWFTPGPGVRARFWNAGHILGAASVEIEVANGNGDGRPLHLVFSGDLGPCCGTFHPAPDAPDATDVLVVEGTYGDRERADLSVEERRRTLRDEVLAALKGKGNLIIPAFAVERTQELLFDLKALFDSGELPPVKVFLDSPLAIRATQVFAKHSDKLAGGNGDGNPFERSNIHFIEDVEQSKGLASFTSSAIILSASGMCDAGRIRFHLRNNLWRAECTVLLVGYQAPGTLGSLLESGVRSVRIMGEEITVRARIRKIETYSGHADRQELLAWVRERLPVSRAVVLTHGEESALAAMRDGVIGLGVEPARVLVPGLGETIDLGPEQSLHRHREAARLAVPAAAAADWHNDYARLVLDIEHRLQAEADDRRRGVLLRRLKRALEAEAD